MNAREQVEMALCALFVWTTILQLVQWWGFFAPFAFSTPLSHKAQKRPVSVIVCARNEAKNLRRFLPAFLAQQYNGPWELLIVNDASEDDTQGVLNAFVEEHADRLRVLNLENKERPGKKFALAQGIQAASYDLLLLSDADCAPASPFWLQEMADALSSKPETEIVLGFAPLQGQPFARYEAAYTAASYFSFAMAGMPYMGVGRNLAFKRQVFERVGGFAAHEHLLSGDDDLLVNAAANARNTAICCAPSAFVYSDAPNGARAWLRQKHRHLSAGPAYRWSHKAMLALSAGSLAGHYALSFLLLVTGIWPVGALALFAWRIGSVWVVFGKILGKFHARDLWWKIGWLDALLAMYYGLAVPILLIGRKRAVW